MLIELYLIGIIVIIPKNENGFDRILFNFEILFKILSGQFFYLKYKNHLVFNKFNFVKYLFLKLVKF